MALVPPGWQYAHIASLVLGAISRGIHMIYSEERRRSRDEIYLAVDLLRIRAKEQGIDIPPTLCWDVCKEYTGDGPPDYNFYVAVNRARKRQEKRERSNALEAVDNAFQELEKAKDE